VVISVGSRAMTQAGTPLDHGRQRRQDLAERRPDVGYQLRRQHDPSAGRRPWTGTGTCTGTGACTTTGAGDTGVAVTGGFAE
jgi:hypothetical protein